MLLEILAVHGARPENALMLIKVDVRKAERDAKSEQINKRPRFFRVPSHGAR